MCDVVWCVCVLLFVLCLCVRSYHVKCVFVCLGNVLRDVVGHGLCACVVVVCVFCLCVCVLFVRIL